MIVFLFGGFGNQLFQVAKALDLTSKDESLHFFDVAGVFQVNHGSKVKSILELKVRSSRLISFLFQFLIIASKLRLVCKLLRITTDQYEHSRPLFLIGYFQDDSVVNRSLPKMEKFFSPLFRTGLDSNSDGLVVHIRRGDFFLPDSPHAVLSLEWYRNLILNLPDQLKSRVFIVTDDFDWAAAGLRDLDVEIVSSNNFLEDFFLIASVNNRILSNSTFSYWADKLGGSSGTTYAPAIWFRGVRTDTIKIFNYNWCLVDV